VPMHLRQVFASAAADFSLDGDVLTQRALAEFINEGHFTTCLKKARTELGARRRVLEGALRARLGDAMRAGGLKISGNAGGMQLTLLLPAHVDDRALSVQLEDLGISAPPLSSYCIGPRLSGLVLGYGATPTEQMSRLVGRLAGPLEQALKAGPAM